jgi:hypothetical protein
MSLMKSGVDSGECTEAAPSALYPMRHCAPTLLSMQIREGRIQEFRSVWKEEFGEELSVDQARHEALLLLELYLALAEPLPQERSTGSNAMENGLDS